MHNNQHYSPGVRRCPHMYPRWKIGCAVRVAALTARCRRHMLREATFPFPLRALYLRVVALSARSTRLRMVVRRPVHSRLSTAILRPVVRTCDGAMRPVRGIDLTCVWEFLNPLSPTAAARSKSCAIDCSPHLNTSGPRTSVFGRQPIMFDRGVRLVRS